jgi:single-strand DNA-binding protein
MAIITGRLTRDPELKDFSTGCVCKFGVAEDQGWGDNKKTAFHNCVAWGKTAEHVAKYFTKGKPIIIEQFEVRYNEHDGKKYTDIVLTGFPHFHMRDNSDNQHAASDSYDDDGDGLPF